MLRKIFLLALFYFLADTLAAQESSAQAKQIWPEVDIYYRFNDRFRLYSKITSTRLNNANTDGTAGIFLDYFALPWFRKRDISRLNDTLRGRYLSLRAGYSYSQTPPGTAKSVDQSIIETTVNGLHYLPEDILLTVTNRIDWLFKNNDFDPRYRPRLKLDRNFKTEYLSFNFYFYGEYYFYFNDNAQDRFRLETGFEVKVLKIMSFQTYYLHQFANEGTVSSIDAIGLQANFYFKKKQAR
jgi:hypothetical protein